MAKKPRTRRRTSSGGDADGFWFDKKEADRIEQFFRLLKHGKGEWAGQSFVLARWQRDDVVRPLFGSKRPDGLRRYRTAYIEVPRKQGKSTLSAGIALALLFADGEPGAEIYCLHPATKVLTADFRWQPVGDLSQGDRLVGFDEMSPGNGLFRRLRVAHVTTAERIVQPCCRITFEDGRKLVASLRHRWLAMRGGRTGPKEWVATQDLRAGVSRVRDLGAPWIHDDSRGGGYLAGVFDGEGCLMGGGVRSGFRVAFAQKPGPVLSSTRQLLEVRGFKISACRDHASGVQTFEIPGLHNCLRFLGEIRPERLLEKATTWIDGKAPNRVNGHALVTNLEYLGEQEVVAIGTTTRTLFAEGLFSHNSAAADRDQAAIVFETAKSMVLGSPELSARCEIYKRSIVVPRLGASYKVLSADAPTKHGLNAHGVIFDELHAQRDRELWDVLTTATAARRQPLVIAITTAGYDRESICYEQHDYAIKVRDQVIPDPSFLPVIYAAGENDDWTSPEVWAKANPNLGISIKAEYLERECAKAKETPAYQNSFRRLHLCQWTSQEFRAVDMEQWKQGATPIDADALASQPCFAGLDLSSTLDISAFVLLFPPTEEKGDVIVLPYFWIPADNIEARVKRDRVPYDVWVRDGFIEATPGNVIDYDYIRNRILELGKSYEIRELAKDRWNSTQIGTQLTEQGVQVIDFGQGYKDMSPPTKEFLALVRAGRLRHGGNPVLTWMASNLAVLQDPADNLKPAKNKSADRIDGVVALIMALGRAAIAPPQHHPFVWVASW